MLIKILPCLSALLLLFLPLAVWAAQTAPPAFPPAPAPGEKLVIEDTVYGVLRTHRNLRGMRENREVLSHEVDRARAGFGPRVDVEGFAGYSMYSTSDTRDSKLDDRFWGYYGASAKLVQPIWDGFATRSRVRGAKSTLDSVKRRLFDTATSLSLDGIAAHIDLLRRRVLYDLAEKNVRDHRDILAQAQDRMNVGADTAADVTQAQSRLARAQSSISEAKASLQVAEETYRRLTGLDPDNLDLVTMPPEVFDDPDKVFELAQKHNPKVLTYMEDIRTARAERELAESEFYPKLNIEAGPDYSDRGGDDDRWIYSFDILATVRWNMFNSGADVAEWKAASARIRQSRQVLYDYVDDLKLDIESTWSNYLAAQEQYKHYSKAIEYNKYTRDAYIEQFQINQRSLLDVLDSINELFNSSTQAETARGNILVGAYRLSALTGNLLPSMAINTGPLETRPPEDPQQGYEKFDLGWFN